MRLVAFLLIGLFSGSARAESPLPAPLRAQDVATLARTKRAEITAARAKARAAAQRPAIVSALDEPTVSFSLAKQLEGQRANVFGLLPLLTLFVVPAVYVVWRSLHLRRARKRAHGTLANGGSP